jgi:phosphonoacetate hydrolase
MKSTFSRQSFVVNGRTYTPPARPVVAICLDGSSDEYFDAALVRGLMPNLQKMILSGFRGLARGALPSFTNVNNASLITGVPPLAHGISGNFFYDTANGQEVMMNSAKYLRADTIPAGAMQAGRRVAVITAKEKLREILGHGLKGIAFSAEKAAEARRDTHGIEEVEKMVGRPAPPIYSAEISLYVLQAGVALLRNDEADFLYLSTTDYMQHAFAPTQPESLAFYNQIDHELGNLLDLGAVVALTADHGMNAKQKANGEPNVIYLETMLEAQFGPGFRVILPITDPYVAHHGALGSFACVHDGVGQQRDEVGLWLALQPGITEVYDRASAARRLELPEDRIGDWVVLSGRDVVIGRTPAYHDLKVLHGGLRSHGGRYEEMVPVILSHPLKETYAARAAGDPRNFDLFDFLMNGTTA